MIGLPWSQHVAFLDDRRLTRTIRREISDKVREFADHPATLMFALGNEIPPGVVRWHGSLRAERFLRALYQDAKSISPASLFTYVNFPPTEFLDLSFFDVCAFNVYLHHENELRVSSTSRATNRYCSPKREPIRFAKAKTDRRRSPRCT
jgi:hypothetical protein